MANAIELATTEMQRAQRGLMLAYEAKDPASAPQSIQLYQDSGTKIDRHPRAVRTSGGSDRSAPPRADVQQNLATWQPRFQELVNICASGDIAKAYALRSQNKLRLSCHARRRQDHRGRAAARARRCRGRRPQRPDGALALDHRAGHRGLARCWAGSSTSR